MLQAVTWLSSDANRHRIPETRLATDHLENLLRSCVQTFRPGHGLVFEGAATHSVLCVLSGWLSLSKCLPGGEIQIVDVALPGEIIEVGAAGGAVSAVSIEAMSDASVAVMPAHTWEAMKLDRPDLGRISSSIRAAAKARLAERILRLGRGRAVMRIAYALLELNIRLEAIGQAQSGRFHLPMNQRVLGNFVGLTSVHVCRTLRQMVGDGLVRVEGHMSVEIRDIDALADLAGVELQVLKYQILAQTNFAPKRQAVLAYA
jgi:CRP/FNR family transcriptional regulator